MLVWKVIVRLAEMVVVVLVMLFSVMLVVFRLAGAGKAIG